MPIALVLQRFSGSVLTRVISRAFTSVLLSVQSLLYASGSLHPELLQANDLAFDASAVDLPGGVFGQGNVLSEYGFETDTGSWAKSGSVNCVASRISGSDAISATYSAGLNSQRISGSLQQTEFGSANYTQIFSSPISVGTLADLPYSFKFAIKNMGSAPNGPYIPEILFYLLSGGIMHYQFRLNGSPLAADTSTDKYISLEENLPLNVSLTFSRDIYTDFVTKGFSLSDTLTGFSIVSNGASVYSPSFGNLNSPANLQLTTKLDWTDTNTTEDGTYIEEKIDGTNTFYIRVGSVGRDVTTFSLPNHPPSSQQQIYNYRVQAFQGTIVSPYSNVVTRTIKAVEHTKKDPPSSNSAEGGGGGGGGGGTPRPE